MKFSNLRFKNFKSFEGTHTFDFSRFSPGLLFLTGDNQVEPKLGANGTGKSTLWDALCWCLYGKTIRSLRAGNVNSWNKGKNTDVSLVFEINGRSHTLDRGWNPNRLLLDFKETTQDVVDSFLDITFEEFQHSIVIGQFSTTFFDLPPTQKLSVLSDILSLEYWLDKSKESNQILTSVSKDIGLLELELVKLTSKVEEKEGILPGLQEASNRFEKDKFTKVTILKNDIKQLIEKKGLKETISIKMEAEIYSLGLEHSECEKSEQEVAENYKGTVEGKTKISIEYYQVETAISLNRGKHKKFSGMIDSICFNCEQVIQEGHAGDILSKLDEENNELQKSFVIYRKQIKEYNLELDKLESQVSEASSKLSDIQEKLQSLKTNSRVLFKECESIEWSIQRSNSSLTSLESEQNKFQPILLETQKRIVELKKVLKTKNQELNDLNKDKIGVEYWVKGFKEIRLTLLKEALVSLDIEVNNNLIQLGLSDWSISFDIERVTKAGTLSKGFQVFINSPLSNDEVPWEAWSGGESQRLRLAGAMGLANLLLNRKGIQSNIEVWDEPSSYLSQSGINDMIEYLSQRANENNKQVWLVDHRSLDFGDFQSTVVITKDESGSHINY